MRYGSDSAGRSSTVKFAFFVSASGAPFQSSVAFTVSMVVATAGKGGGRDEPATGEHVH